MGLVSMMTYWIYTAGVRAIFTYGWQVWWESLDRMTNLNLVGQLRAAA